ncbi:hypothetical protein ACFIJ5_05430 [Haloimpatiens sp. FM7330]|uniref:hypothetical protein n=1 Tax=Haloimpatiens sp. FM7330 TaxID=3298610 RepID=UPI0036393929
MWNMYSSDSLAPRFIIFKYIIRWYIEHFGIACYITIFVGVIFIFLIRALVINVKRKEFDRVLMLIIFTSIVIGGLLGVGMDFYNNNIDIP